ncbi:MAG: hypothetical protein ACREIC_21090 [Limisphaerales bacterium]
MQTEQNNGMRMLEAGQLWKVEQGYVYIVELGKRLIHYKMLRNPGQVAALTRLIGIEALLRYLAQSEAELVSGAGVLAQFMLQVQPGTQIQSAASPMLG